MDLAFSAIPYFVAVVETGSCSLAADKLNVTKSAISKRISQMEDELGIRLLNRTTRKLSLTEAGERYYELVSQSLSLAQQGVDAVTELQGEPQGKLKVTAPMSFGIRHIAPLLAEFLQHYPKVEVEMQMEDQMVDMVNEGYDLAIRIGHLPSSNLIARRLTPARTLLCASPEYIRRCGEPGKPSDLVHHNCIAYSYFRGGSEWRFMQNNSEFKALPRGNLVLNNSEAIRRAVLDGLGIGQLPTFIASQDIVNGHLQQVMREYTLPEHNIYAVYPARKHLPLKVRVFIEFITEKLGNDEAYWDQAIREAAGRGPGQRQTR